MSAVHADPMMCSVARFISSLVTDLVHLRMGFCGVATVIVSSFKNVSQSKIVSVLVISDWVTSECVVSEQIVSVG